MCSASTPEPSIIAVQW